MLAILWIVNLSVSAVLAMLTGLSAISFSLVGGCAITMRYFLQDSGDILDARGGFYLAVLLFITIPGVVRPESSVEMVWCGTPSSCLGSPFSATTSITLS